jgi:magnesium transporter
LAEERYREAWEQLAELVEQKDTGALIACLEELSSGEIGRALSRLDDDIRSQMLILLGPEEAADLLEELYDTQGAEMIEDLEPHEAAAIIDEMESDHRVDVLAEMDDEDMQAILDKMDPEEAEDARLLLPFADDVAGGIMVTEYLYYSMHMRVSDVLDDMQRNAETYTDYSVQYAYVVTDEEHLVGVVRLRDIVLSPRDTELAKVMIANPIYVYVDTPLDELDEFFDRYPFVAVPVVDHACKMVGVVRRGDAEEAYSQRTEQSLMRFGGIIGGDESRTMPLFSRSFRRVAWLIPNMALSLVGASVILRFEATIQNVIALVFFIPVIVNVSGCSGNQAVAVSIRDLSTGMIQPKDFVLVWWKELQVACINGIGLGVLLAIVALVLYADPMLALVVGVALTLNNFIALTLGGLVPLGLKAARLDPALAAPLIVTTFCDMCGFFIVLSLAALVLAGSYF